MNGSVVPGKQLRQHIPGSAFFIDSVSSDSSFVDQFRCPSP
jgi:hypothetical protein